jgi:hypothetical protein
LVFIQERNEERRGEQSPYRVFWKLLKDRKVIERRNSKNSKKTAADMPNGSSHFIAREDVMQRREGSITY